METIDILNNKKNALKFLLLPFSILAFTPALIAGTLGWKDLQVISVIKTAYSLWRAGNSVRTALSIATGGWGWAVSFLLQFGIAYLASQAFKGSWLVGF